MTEPRYGQEGGHKEGIKLTTGGVYCWSCFQMISQPINTCAQTILVISRGLVNGKSIDIKLGDSQVDTDISGTESGVVILLVCEDEQGSVTDGGVIRLGGV